MVSGPDRPAPEVRSSEWYERVAVDVFARAQADAADLHKLAERSPVWEEMCARFAGVTARFAEAAAAASLAQLAGRFELE